MNDMTAGMEDSLFLELTKDRNKTCFGFIFFYFFFLQAELMLSFLDKFHTQDFSYGFHFTRYEK